MMKQKYLQISLKLFAIIGLLSVGVFAQNALFSKRWELAEINNKRIYSSKAFLEIAPSENRFAGNAGCNRMFGEVKISGKKINFGSVGATRMFCNDRAAMKLETDFTRALERVTRFEKSGNTLKLYARNRLILRFKGASNSENSAVKLEDKKWVLESIKNKTLPKVETEPFISFDQTKNSAGGNTGCNVFGGSYTATGAKIKVFELISTMRACIEDERMNVEREFKNSLDKANRYEIVGEKLELFQDRTLLLTFRAEAK